MKFLFAIAILSLAISTACTASRSASPPLQLANANVTTQPTPQSSATIREKQSCQLTVSHAPTFDGVGLGMKAEDVLALFPGSKDDPEIRAVVSRPPGEFGVSDLAIRPAKYQNSSDKPLAVGAITRISLTFLDGRAYIVQAAYNGPAYAHVDDFVKSFVGDRTLPPVDDWDAYTGLDNQLKILTCRGFEVRVFAGGEGGKLNYVAIKDLRTEEKFEERVRKAEGQPSPTPGKQ